MKNKIWIIVIAVLLVLIATVVIININKDEVDTTEINMEVKRDESVDIDKIKENFNTNIQNIKDGINKQENE